MEGVVQLAHDLEVESLVQGVGEPLHLHREGPGRLLRHGGSEGQLSMAHQLCSACKQVDQGMVICIYRRRGRQIN